MSIEYLNNKIIDINDVCRYLNISKEHNHYTNNGPVKKILEEKLCQILELNESKKVLCLSNGTAAIQALMFLCKKHNINKWIIPAYTFPSAIVGNIFDVKIEDISLDSYTIDLEKAKDFDGMIITNLFGSFVDIYEFTSFCKNNNIKLVFDNAASPLSKYNGINICNFGDYCIGSLHHTKYMGYGEGGFIVCDKEDYEILESLTNFGFPNPKENMQFASNFKMSDVSAAFILAHINNFNKDNYLEIQNKMINEIGKDLLFNYNEGVIYNSMPILFKNPISIDFYRKNGVQVNKYYRPLLDNAKNSHHIYERIINLPLHTNLSDKDILKIKKTIDKCY